MNIKLKHIILGCVGLVLLLVSPFILRKAENEEQFKKLWLGYPIPFVAQDFSSNNKSFAYFPNYGKLEINSQNPIVNFSVVNFVLSWAIIFIFIEILIYFLENIKYWFQTKYGKDKPGEDGEGDLN